MLNDKVISELKEKHGDALVAVEASGVTLVFKRPTRGEFDRWFDKRSDHGTAAARELAQACLVYPARDEMIAALDQRPAMLMCRGGILDAITELAGLSEDAATAKKL
jgi:hypothetical protein